MKEFCDMGRKEKKDFLSIDFADRMIRIEQNLSRSFDKPLTYDKTSFFKSLTPSQKEKFQKYIKNRGKRKLFFGFILILPILIVFLLNSNFTGNFIKESLDLQTNFLISSILICILGIILIILIILFIRKKMRDRKFKKNSRIIDEIIIKKSNTKSKFQNHKKA